jgi:dUTP pyrophosphatase
MLKQIKFIRESSDIEIPSYATKDSSGMDIRAYLPYDKSYMGEGFRVYASQKGDNYNYIELHAGGRILIPSGIKVEVPKGYEIQVRPRSGLALKHGIGLLNSPGTIDADYRGDVGVILVNHSNKSFHIENGDRIAQLVFAKVTQVSLVEEEISETERGEGGFGHTGKN